MALPSFLDAMPRARKGLNRVVGTWRETRQDVLSGLAGPKPVARRCDQYLESPLVLDPEHS